MIDKNIISLFQRLIQKSQNVFLNCGFSLRNGVTTGGYNLFEKKTRASKPKTEPKQIDKKHERGINTQSRWEVDGNEKISRVESKADNRVSRKNGPFGD